MSKRAPFVVVEGLDRSGKTTQVSLLQNIITALGKSVKVLKFPDRTTAIGGLIDSYLTSQAELEDHAIHLLFSANRWELASSIEQLLLQGTIVLCDRYAFSGLAFSASKGLSYEWCRHPEIGLPAPDITLFLDISPEKAKERGGYGQERYETETIQHQVRTIFGRIAVEMNGYRDTTQENWINIDAGREREAVTQDLWAHVEPLVSGIDLPIRRLWTHMNI